MDPKKYYLNCSIVRKPGNDLPDYAINISELAPNLELFESYKKAISENIFNKMWFEIEYVPKFIDQIAKTETKRILQELVDLSREKNVLLACYCKNSNLCHRSIVISILFNLGCKTDVDVLPIEHEKYYKMFQEKIKLKNYLKERTRYFQEVLSSCDEELCLRLQEEVPRLKRYVAEMEKKDEMSPEIILANCVLKISADRVKKWRTEGWTCGTHRAKSKKLFLKMLQALFTGKELNSLVQYCCLQHQSVKNLEMENALQILLLKAPNTILIDFKY